MTLSKIVSLASIAFGVLGTVALFKGSFAYERPFTYDEDWDAMFARNRRRRSKQMIGLALLATSFVLQGVAQFAD
jgi:hypothetical protein